jgi:Clr5 domain
MRLFNCPEQTSEECNVQISFYFHSAFTLPQSVNRSQAFPQSMEASEGSPNPKFRFKDGTAKNAARVPKAKWDEHKELLCSLYQEMTSSDICAFMRTEHGFVAK